MKLDGLYLAKKRGCFYDRHTEEMTRRVSCARKGRFLTWQGSRLIRRKRYCIPKGTRIITSIAWQAQCASFYDGLTRR